MAAFIAVADVLVPKVVNGKQHVVDFILGDDLKVTYIFTITREDLTALHDQCSQLRSLIKEIYEKSPVIGQAHSILPCCKKRSGPLRQSSQGSFSLVEKTVLTAWLEPNRST